MNDRATRVRQIIEDAALAGRRRVPIQLYPARARRAPATRKGYRAGLLALAVAALLPLSRDPGPTDRTIAEPVAMEMTVDSASWQFSPGPIDPGERALRILSGAAGQRANGFEVREGESPAL